MDRIHTWIPTAEDVLELSLLWAFSSNVTRPTFRSTYPQLRNDIGEPAIRGSKQNRGSGRGGRLTPSSLRRRIDPKHMRNLPVRISPSTDNAGKSANRSWDEMCTMEKDAHVKQHFLQEIWVVVVIYKGTREKRQPSHKRHVRHAVVDFRKEKVVADFYQGKE